MSLLMEKMSLICKEHEKEVKMICTNGECVFGIFLCEECIWKEIHERNCLHLIKDGKKIKKLENFVSEFQATYTEIKKLIKDMQAKLEDKNFIVEDEESFTEIVGKKSMNDFAKSLYESGVKIRNDFVKYFSDPSFLVLIDTFTNLINSFNLKQK